MFLKFNAIYGFSAVIFFLVSVETYMLCIQNIYVSQVKHLCFNPNHSPTLSDFICLYLTLSDSIRLAVFGLLYLYSVIN